MRHFVFLQTNATLIRFGTLLMFGVYKDDLSRQTLLPFPAPSLHSAHNC